MKNGFAPQPAVNGFAEQRLRAFVDDVVAPAERQRQAADRAAMMDWAGSTWPAVAAKAALSGAMLPGDVAQGKFSMDDPRAIERLTDLTGLITLGAGALPAQKNSLRAGIKAYHGSPHDFDEFSLSKIGTGEGGAMKGRGINLTDYEAEAYSYRKPDLRHGIPPSGKSRFDGPGHMYEVEVDADPADFADLDARMKDQPEHIRNVVAPRVRADDEFADHRRLSFYLTADGSLEKELKEIGVPGFSAKVSDSQHYVVFDDKLISILRKYGIAVPAGMAGYEMTQDQFRRYVGDQQAQQYERENNATRLGIL